MYRTHVGIEQAGFCCSVIAWLMLALIAVPDLAVANDRIQGAKINFDIPRQRTDHALIEFAQQANVTFIFPTELAERTFSNPLVGTYSFNEALTHLLEGTLLVPEFTLDGVKVIGRADEIHTSEETDTVLNKQQKSGFIQRIGLALVAAFSVSANAQGQSESASENPLGMEEVIVTATKRETSLQDTAMSITALGSAEINHRGLVGMGDYLNSVPGVTFQDRGAGRNTVIMRGIAVDPELEALGSGGSAVGIYLDDIALAGYSTGSNADVKLIDMNRVEVLRGPQGTLYGSSALGGAVRNISNKPNLAEFEGMVKTGYSATDGAGHGNYLVEGVLNVPLVTDQLAIRFVGYQHQNSGYIDNVAGDDPRSIAVATAGGLPGLAVNEDSVGDDEYSGGRLSVLWTPTDRFSARLSYLAQKLEQTGIPEVQLEREDNFEQTRLQMKDFIGSNEGLEHKFESLGLNLDYEFEWAALQFSATSLDIDYLENRDVHALFPAGSLLGDVPVPQSNPEDSEFFTSEVRLVSDLDGAFQFVTGIYLEEVDLYREQNTYLGVDPALNPFGDPNLLGFSLDTNLEQLAFYGEAYYDLNEQFTLTVGARHFDYERDDLDVRSGALAGGQPPTLLTIDESGENYKVNLSYTPNDSTLLYAQWAEGFRLGRGNLPVPASLCDLDSDGVVDGTNLTLEQLRQINSDTLDTYELGGKFSFLENRATLNVAIYRTNWDGLPQVIPFPCGVGVSVNSGEARTQGVEVEGSFRVSDSLQLNLGMSVKDGELTRVLPGVPAEAGDRLPGSADFNFSAGLEYDFTLFERNTYLRADYVYVGGYYTNLQELGPESGDYHIGNIRTGMTFNQFDLGLFVDNLTNSDETVFTSSVYAQDLRAVRLRPRTIGVDLQFNF